MKRPHNWLCASALYCGTVTAALLLVRSSPSIAFAAQPAPGRSLRGGFRHAQGAAPPTYMTSTASAASGIAVAAVAAGAAACAARAELRAGGPCRRGVRRASSMALAASDTEAAGVVLLSAGVGKRMGAKIPKQYLKLLGREIALHSLEVFLNCDVAEIVIVCAEEWRSLFEDYLASRGDVKPVIKFTTGGKERQDSVNNGLDEISTGLAAIHDAARPLVTKEEVEKVISDARQYGAALLAVKTKATIKQATQGSEGENLVATTPDRSTLWEAHTPQVVEAALLREGFRNAAEKNLAVTDDVSLVEFLGKPVKLTEGEYTNIKVTTPEDISVAEAILRSRGFEPVLSLIHI